MNSHWLPEEIKEKMLFVNIHGIADFDESVDHDKYVRLAYKHSEKEKWIITFPSFTLESFSDNLFNLYMEIENWLANNSKIRIPLFNKSTKR